MSTHNEHTGRFGGPGSSHQDREHPGTEHSRQPGGGGERDVHHRHTDERS